MLAGREPQAEGRRLEAAPGSPGERQGTGCPEQKRSCGTSGHAYRSAVRTGPGRICYNEENTPAFLSPLPAIVHWKFAEHSLGLSGRLPQLQFLPDGPESCRFPATHLPSGLRCHGKARSGWWAVCPGAPPVAQRRLKDGIILVLRGNCPVCPETNGNFTELYKRVPTPCGPRCDTKPRGILCGSGLDGMGVLYPGVRVLTERRNLPLDRGCAEAVEWAALSGLNLQAS